MHRPPPWLVFLRIFLGFLLPVLLANGLAELLRGTKFRQGAPVAVLLIGIPLGIWLGFVIARRHDRRRFAAGPRFGTRAWEADQTAQLIAQVMADRRVALARATGDAKARLEAELAHLAPQLEEQRRIAASGDPSPARGRIAFDLPG
jgi:hypothetical protein